MHFLRRCRIRVQARRRLPVQRFGNALECPRRQRYTRASLLSVEWAFRRLLGTTISARATLRAHLLTLVSYTHQRTALRRAACWRLGNAWSDTPNRKERKEQRPRFYGALVHVKLLGSTSVHYSFWKVELALERKSRWISDSNDEPESAN